MRGEIRGRPPEANVSTAAGGRGAGPATTRRTGRCDATSGQVCTPYFVERVCLSVVQVSSSVNWTSWPGARCMNSRASLWRVTARETSRQGAPGRWTPVGGGACNRGWPLRACETSDSPPASRSVQAAGRWVCWCHWPGGKCANAVPCMRGATGIHLGHGAWCNSSSCRRRQKARRGHDCHLPRRRLLSGLHRGRVTAHIRGRQLGGQSRAPACRPDARPMHACIASVS